MGKKQLREILNDLLKSETPSFEKLSENLDLTDKNTKNWFETLKKEKNQLLFRSKVALGIRLLDFGDIKAKKNKKPKRQIVIENSEQDGLLSLNPLFSGVDKQISSFYSVLASRAGELVLPPSSLKGCGSVIQNTLFERDIFTLYDLLSLFPLSYTDLRHVSSVSDLEKSGERKTVLLKVKITSVSFFRGKLSAKAEDETGEISMFWFAVYPGLYSVVSRGNTVYVRGTFDFKGNTPHFVHPLISLKRPDEFILSYPKIEGLGETRLRKLILAALEKIKNIDYEPLPEQILNKYGFLSWKETVNFLHNPPAELDDDDFSMLVNGSHPAELRMAYEELFFIQMMLVLKNKNVKNHKGVKILRDEYDEIIKVLPFKLTDSQRKTVKLMLDDMETGVPMNRLLQGDVGAGKTAVAFVLAAHVMSVGRQVAFMAPTTLLAEQQYATLKNWAGQLGYKTALLTSDMPSGVRESILARLENGDIDLLVGTQSLIQSRVLFADLGFVIIDEQHRFGVKQRAMLREKGGDVVPHMLVMTATPIPRSLALTVYGELDLVIMEGKPPGRLPVKTKIVSTQKQKNALLKKLDKVLEKGEKIFVVAPLVDKGEEKQRSDVYLVSDTLKKLMTNARIEVLHGRMPSSEKESLISGFRKGKINVLVTTTVIEVGMDIPDASYMIILEADRFGLAALHQLRGRIGRSPGKQAFCYLFTSRKVSKEGRERINILESSSDGFELAETDLKMRGPGEITGTRQSGVLSLRYASLVHHGDLLLNARNDARELLDSVHDLQKEYPLVYSLVMNLSEYGFYGEEAG